jgi:hypothetical protein
MSARRVGESLRIISRSRSQILSAEAGQIEHSQRKDPFGSPTSSEQQESTVVNSYKLACCPALSKGAEIAPGGNGLPLNRDVLWYKDAIIYQVHFRTFYDSNGDGIGDFQGLEEKLGCDALQAQ